jgi:hypothetical protein
LQRKKSENENTHCSPNCKKRKLNESEVFSSPARKTPEKKKKNATTELIHSWKKTKKEGGFLPFFFLGIALETYLSIRSSPPPPPALSSPVKKEDDDDEEGAGGRKPKAGRKRWCFVNLALGGNPGVMRNRPDLLRC